MKVSLLSENLQKKILFVNHAVSNHSQLPILLNFLITAKEGKLSISATDLEIGIISEVPAKIEKEGQTTVPAKTLTELTSAISQGKITLEAQPEGLVLIGEKIKTTFQTAPSDEFPKLYEEKGEELMVLQKETISKDFSRIAFAASQDTERPALSGVLIKEDVSSGGKGFVFVATDGYRLSLKKQSAGVKKKTSEDLSMIIPSRVIRELVLMNKETAENSEIKVCVPKGNNQTIFTEGDTTLIGRLIEAEFPNYEKIIPVDFSTKTVFDREELHKAIKVGYVFARQTASIVKLSITKDKIVVSANAPSVGENTIEVDAKTTGEENEIAFNARYLLDLLSNTTSENMSFEMTGPLNPGVFREVGDDSFMHLIMPIRVQGQE